MLYAVFDTNWVMNSKSFDHLLGSVEDLKAISEYATIVLPEMVIEEVLEDKRDAFHKAFRTLRDSPIRELMEITDMGDPQERFHSIEENLRKDHSIDYLLVGVTDAEGAFRKACELAVNHQPPFEKSSDKGFKDFVIGWTVKELLAKAPNDQVVVLTKDNRLKDYLEESLGVKVVKLKEDFIELAQSSQARTISKDDYAGLNEAARLRSGERNERDDVSILINSLKLSDNFNTTRGLIPALAQRRNEMSSDDKVALLRIAVKNTQVRWLLHDDDIASFFVPLLAECGDSLSVREVDELVASFKDDHLIEVCACMDIDATDEYTSFVRKFDISLISVEAGARIESLSFRILPRLKAVIVDNKMERRIPFGSDVYESFIEPGKFECMSWGFDFDVLESFVNMMESVGWQQRFLMCRSIASRIREVADRST